MLWYEWGVGKATGGGGTAESTKVWFRLTCSATSKMASNQDRGKFAGCVPPLGVLPGLALLRGWGLGGSGGSAKGPEPSRGWRLSDVRATRDTWLSMWPGARNSGTLQGDETREGGSGTMSRRKLLQDGRRVLSRTIPFTLRSVHHPPVSLPLLRPLILQLSRSCP